MAFNGPILFHLFTEKKKEFYHCPFKFLIHNQQMNQKFSHFICEVLTGLVNV